MVKTRQQECVATGAKRYTRYISRFRHQNITGRNYRCKRNWQVRPGSVSANFSRKGGQTEDFSNSLSQSSRISTLNSFTLPEGNGYFLVVSTYAPERSYVISDWNIFLCQPPNSERTKKLRTPQILHIFLNCYIESCGKFRNGNLLTDTY